MQCYFCIWLTSVVLRCSPMRHKDSPNRCRWAAAQTGSLPEQLELPTVDLREPQVDVMCPRAEPSRLQVSARGFHADLRVLSDPCSGAGGTAQGQQVRGADAVVAGAAAGQAANWCMSSGYTQQSNTQLWLCREKDVASWRNHCCPLLGSICIMRSKERHNILNVLNGNTVRYLLNTFFLKPHFLTSSLFRIPMWCGFSQACKAGMKPGGTGQAGLGSVSFIPEGYLDQHSLHMEFGKGKHSCINITYNSAAFL